MANDEFDNARTDKAMLAELEKRFADERAKRKAADPRKRLVDTICQACKGSGLDAKLTVFEWDEFNPEGHWAEVHCDVCHGSGLSTGVDNAIQNGVFAERDLKHTRDLLSKAVEGLSKAREAARNVDYEVDADVGTEEQLGALVDELTEVLDAVDPEPPEED